MSLTSYRNKLLIKLTKSSFPFTYGLKTGLDLKGYFPAIITEIGENPYLAHPSHRHFLHSIPKKFEKFLVILPTIEGANLTGELPLQTERLGCDPVRISSSPSLGRGRQRDKISDGRFKKAIPSMCQK